jgi:hypothetical protein
LKREQDKRKPKKQGLSVMTDPLIAICTHILRLWKERTYGGPAGIWTRRLSRVLGGRLSPRELSRSTWQGGICP